MRKILYVMLSTLICASLFATNASQIDYAPDNLSAELKIDSTDFDGTQHVWTFNLPQNKTIKVTRINSVHLIRNNVETMQLLVDETNDLITDVRDIYKAGIFVDTIENATSLKVVLNFPQNFSYQPKNPVITIRFAVIDEHPSTELILLNGDVEVVSGAFSTSGYQDFMGTKVTAILGDDYNEYTCFGSARGGMIRGSNEGYLILSGNPNGYGNRNVYINRYTSNGDVIMTAGSGQVGIGVDDPEYKLDVAGTIRADELITDGTIRASRIVVQDVNGADFVFDKNYNLRSLCDLQAYIDTYQHLPEIPSAQEMKEQGVDMSILQIQLLQKIEELTLYILQQERTIQELKQEISNLKK